MNYKYKPGDQVQIQANAFYSGDRYHMLSGPIAEKLVENTITISERTVEIRNRLLNQIVTIVGYSLSRYVIKECNKNVLWTDDMFVEKVCEEDSGECYCPSLL